MKLPAAFLMCILMTACGCAADGLPRIVVSKDGRTLVEAGSGKPFVAWGFNYDRDYQFRLIEDYWVEDWQTVVRDFREMKSMGANVVRVHLQIGRFMDSPEQANESSLRQLDKLLQLAEQTGLYLDITGLACFRKSDIPAWYDKLDEAGRWQAQARFWEAIARRGARSDAVLMYDLVNEPVVPDRPPAERQWLVGTIGPFSYVQYLSLDPAGRNWRDIATAWSAQMRAAIRRADPNHLITVGFMPITHDLARTMSPNLDLICVHLYPNRGKLKEDEQTLSRFDFGKPVIVGEIFPLNCSVDDLREFITTTSPKTSGYIGFYWGRSIAQLEQEPSPSAAMTRGWLELFAELTPSVLNSTTTRKPTSRP